MPGNQTQLVAFYRETQPAVPAAYSSWTRLRIPPFFTNIPALNAKVTVVPNKEGTKRWASFGGRAIEDGGRHFFRCLVNAKQTALDGISRQAALPSWAMLSWPFCGSGFAPHSHIGGILKLI